MTQSTSASEARSALTTVDYSREQVIAEIDMPRWYWLGLAAGWIVIGVISDIGSPWLAVAAMLLFGAVHGAAAQHVLSGRRRSRQLSVRAELTGSHIPAVVVGFLVGLTGVTIAAALLINADGADHPATIASVIAAVAIACGGPELMAAVRQRASRNSRR